MKFEHRNNEKCKPWQHEYEGKLDSFYPETGEKGPAPTDVVRNHIKSFLHITRLTTQQKIVVLGAFLFLAICLSSYLLFGRALLRLVSDSAAFWE